MTSRAQFAAALLLDLLGAAGVLLVSMRTWQTVVTARPRPLADDVLNVSGRTIDAAATALGLVALAGVVAVLATRGLARRAVGVVLTAAGIAIIWRSLTGLSRLSSARARWLVESTHTGVGIDSAVVPSSTVHHQWVVLSVIGGALVLSAGGMIAARGHLWISMSAKYDPPAEPPSAADAASMTFRRDASLWSALDRGDDPTTGSNHA